MFVEFLKGFDAAEPRDAKGRWTSGGSRDVERAADQVEHAAVPPSEPPEGERRSGVRQLAGEVVSYLHDAASRLASKAAQAITSTRLVGINPTNGGGLEIVTASPMGKGAGHVLSRVQLHPHDFRNNPRAASVVTGAHLALAAAGRKFVPVRSPLDIRYANGDAPGTFSSP